VTTGQLDVVALARAIAAGEITAEAAIGAALERAAAWQPRINAFVALEQDTARERARVADARRTGGATLPSLHGVPIALKDMFDRRDRRPGCGAGPGAAAPGLADAALVTRLERAGAIVIGTLNMTEYALGLTGHNDHIGDCANPWDTTRVTGGSSSGPAAAVAARIVPAAIGSDTGASIRLPAAWCGVVGLKPTHGGVDSRGAMPMSFTLDAIGPLATTTRGAARLMDAISQGPRAGGCEAALTGDIRGRHIGVVEGYFGDGLDPGVADAIGRAIDVLRARGAIVDVAHIGCADLARRLHRLMMAAEAASLHERALAETPERFTAEVRYRLELGRRVPATSYLAASRGRARLLQQFLAESFGPRDALLTALVPRPAPPRAATRFGAAGFRAELLADIPKRTQPISYLGLPALALPCGLVDGLPVGLQLVGRPYDEATLLAIGDAYERDTDWYRHAPSP
jgi:aspartyl-tRNA(Asn)/glutamyl-tRNA(Gln) amidotransferase subunit A